MDKLTTGTAIAITWGLILESVAAPAPGFYLFTSLAIILIFFTLPFTISFINGLVSWFAAIFISWLWAWHLANFTPPSYKFILHLMLYTFIVSAIIYVSQKTQKYARG